MDRALLDLTSYLSDGTQSSSFDLRKLNRAHLLTVGNVGKADTTRCKGQSWGVAWWIIFAQRSAESEIETELKAKGK